MTISSTWTCDRGEAPLQGCGVDAERIERFRTDAGPDGEPWSQLFTEREVAHCRRLSDPALGLCAAFCAKESMIKAVGVPIDYRSCELLFRPDQEELEVLMSREFRDEHALSLAVARVMLNRETDECVVAVCAFGRS